MPVVFWRCFGEDAREWLVSISDSSTLVEFCWDWGLLFSFLGYSEPKEVITYVTDSKCVTIFNLLPGERKLGWQVKPSQLDILADSAGSCREKQRLAHQWASYRLVCVVPGKRPWTEMDQAWSPRCWHRKQRECLACYLGSAKQTREPGTAPESTHTPVGKQTRNCCCDAGR